MPIGKDSIQKRVAKVAAPEQQEEEKKTPVETSTKVAEKPAAKPAATKKPAAEKSAAKPAAPKAPAKKPATAKKPADTAPATAVMANVSPETVEKVVGHAEGAPEKHVQIGHKMPTHLL